MAGKEYLTGCFVGSHFVDTRDALAVEDKFRLKALASVSVATPDVAERALSLAASYQPTAGYRRAEILRRVRDRLAARREAFRDLLVAEAGFPLRDAEGEVARAIETLALSAEEAKRIGGEVVPFDGAPGGAGRMGFTMRVPVGVVVAITPFNAPLNTVCHKIGPAFAAGNAVILKPSEKTPLVANLLASLFAEAGCPPGGLAVLHGGPPVAEALLADQRPGFYAFTGSTAAGASIHAKAGLRRTQMELGSIAGTIIMADADLDMAIPKCVGASFRKAGQVCTSIQMLLVERSVYDEVRERYVDGVGRLVAGDPAEAGTDVGPMISVAAAERVEGMLGGETVLTGGAREGAVLSPTVIERPADDSRALTEEIFGPVACLVPIEDLEEAISRINGTLYGLATGLFTSDIDTAFAAARRLRVGGVHINETSSSRVDLMPYGGVKASGFGHEGPKYAVREMSEERLITFSGLSG
ncbi:aldehyde dehydrogenase family protein [Aestuariibius sp. 2305UL40-4]|uniref:aldehyde dehydrogenase family protein n=1 Tax=Aestuariibius violaceus TaxID=3234132 RepID=UPI00345EB9DF